MATLERADKVFDLSRVIATDPSSAIAAFFDEATMHTVPGLTGFIWHTQTGELDGAVVDEAFAFMTIRMRTLEYQHGVRLVMSVDRCTLPLGRELLQIFEAEPCPGGCRVRWRVAVCLVPRFAFGATPVLAAFGRLFARVLDAVQRRFAPPL